MARGRAGFRKEMSIEEPVINLTPLIDVVFVILIMFILIAPLLDIDLVELAEHARTPLNQTSTSVQESSPIAIHVYMDNTIAYNNQPVSLDQLREQLTKAKVHYPKVNPQVFHDRRAHFGTYQSVKNTVEEAGFSEMEIILKPS